MNLYIINKIKSYQLFFPENMVYIIFLLKTSHLMEYHKFVSWISETEDMIFARLQEIWIWIKERRGPLGHWQRVPHVSDPEIGDTLAGECSLTVSFSGGSKGTNMDPTSMEVGDTRVAATERCRRRPWRHGGATSAYAGHLRPVERRGRAA